MSEEINNPIQRNCKNCGAPIKHSYNHKCEHCGTLFDFNAPIEETEKVQPHTVHNIEFNEVYRDIRSISLIFRFTGITLGALKILEYDVSDNTCISVAEDAIHPKRCSFIISISLKELERWGTDIIAWRLFDLGIRDDEIERIIHQIKRSNYYREECVRGFYE